MQTSINTQGSANALSVRDELVIALQFYLDCFPAFRSKPIGEPGSIERRSQEIRIAMEDKAIAAIGRRS